MASGLRSFASSDRFIAEIEASCTGGVLRPGYVLLGDEAYLHERCRRAILDTLIDAGSGPAMRDFALAEIDLAETSIFEALDRAQTPSLMAPFQVLFLRNLKTLYTRGAKKDEFAALDGYGRSPNPQALLVFVADHLHLPSDLRRMDMQDKDRYERIRETLGDWCGMVELVRVEESDAMRWLVVEAEKRGSALEVDAARELARVMPGMVMPGKPVRGGGRATSTRPGEAGVGMELERLRALHPALQRRVLRAAAEQLGSALSFDQTEAVRALTDVGERLAGKGGRVELGAGLTAERTARELRLSRSSERSPSRLPELVVPVPGVLEAAEYGYRVTTEGRLPSGTTLVLRTPQPGDQVRLPHSRGLKTVKEVLERRGLSAAQRKVCPLLATGSSILWMSGVEVEWTPGLQVAVEPFGEWRQPPVPEGAPDAT
jgi:hypothetical protein